MTNENQTECKTIWLWKFELSSEFETIIEINWHTIFVNFQRQYSVYTLKFQWLRFQSLISNILFCINSESCEKFKKQFCSSFWFISSILEPFFRIPFMCYPFFVNLNFFFGQFLVYSFEIMSIINSLWSCPYF